MLRRDLAEKDRQLTEMATEKDRQLAEMERRLEEVSRERDQRKDRAQQKNKKEESQANKELVLLHPEFALPLEKILKNLDDEVKGSMNFRSSCKSLWAFGQRFPLSVDLDVTVRSLGCGNCNWDDDDENIVIHVEWWNHGRHKRLTEPLLQSIAKCSQVSLYIDVLDFKAEFSSFEQFKKLTDQLNITKICKVKINFWDVSDWDLNQMIPKYDVEKVTGHFVKGLRISHPKICCVELEHEDFDYFEDMFQFFKTCSSPKLKMIGCLLLWSDMSSAVTAWVEGDKSIEKWELSCEISEGDLLDRMEELAKTHKERVAMKLLPKAYRLTRIDGAVVVVSKGDRFIIEAA